MSNYVSALSYGMQRIEEDAPLTLRLLREIHGILLAKGRGQEKQPGEFRRSQNWIGGTRPGNALVRYALEVSDTSSRAVIPIRAGVDYLDHLTISKGLFNLQTLLLPLLPDAVPQVHFTSSAFSRRTQQESYTVLSTSTSKPVALAEILGIVVDAPVRRAEVLRKGSHQVLPRTTQNASRPQSGPRAACSHRASEGRVNDIRPPEAHEQ